MRKCSPVTDIAGQRAHIHEERIQLHYLGELSFAESDAIHRHLESCTQCKAIGTEIVETMAAIALAGDYEQKASDDRLIGLEEDHT
jgi:anti-sigma factor RsiW